MGARLNTPSGGRYQVRQNSEINVTPFVDVMLVLLIIFMVSMPSATTSLKLNLPPAKAPPVGEKPPELTVVNVRLDGVFVGDRSVTLAGLPAEVVRAAGAKTARVYIRADRTVRYERFMEVMNTLQDAGFFQIALINEELQTSAAS